MEQKLPHLMKGGDTLVNLDLLRDYIRKSGLRISFICDRLGLSRESFRLKMNGSREFKVSEMKTLCDVLELAPDVRDAIFFA